MSPDLDTLLDASELPDPLVWQGGEAPQAARGTRIVCGCCRRTVLVNDTMDGVCCSCSTGAFAGPDSDIPAFAPRAADEALPPRDPVSIEDVVPGAEIGWLLIESVVRSERGRRAAGICKCGARFSTLAATIARGATRSCGCAARLQTKARNRVHGMHRAPEYSSWASMRSRCLNPNVQNYANYGGRGITVCERWQSFESFIADMGPRPSPKHSLDRVDNSRGYEPGNVRWATRAEQARHTRATVWVTTGGRQVPAVDFLAEFGAVVAERTFYARMRKGWDPVEAATLTRRAKPARPRVGRAMPRGVPALRDSGVWNAISGEVVR